LNLANDLSRNTTLPNTCAADVVGSRNLGARNLGTQIINGRRKGDSVQANRVLGSSRIYFNTFGNCIINPESGVLANNRRNRAEALRVNLENTLSSCAISDLTLRNTSK
jgi:hypothetical protein